MKPTTYGQLSRALKTLGFRKVESFDSLAFLEEEHDAVIALPLEEESKVLGAAHQLMVERTVVGRGVASPAELMRALQRARRPVVHRTLPGQASGSATENYSPEHKRKTRAAPCAEKAA